MIDDIYKVDTFLHEKFNYVGTLRNQYKFNIEDDVFFSPIGTNDIHRGKIVGVERLESLNAEYLYKVAFCGGSNQTVKLECDRIFKSIEDAKKSAKNNLLHRFQLQRSEIERYFKAFENN